MRSTGGSRRVQTAGAPDHRRHRARPSVVADGRRRRPGSNHTRAPCRRPTSRRRRRPGVGRGRVGPAGCAALRVRHRPALAVGRVNSRPVGRPRLRLRWVGRLHARHGARIVPVRPRRSGSAGGAPPRPSAALHLHAREQPIQPRRHPPSPAAEELHHRRYDKAPDNHRVGGTGIAVAHRPLLPRPRPRPRRVGSHEWAMSVTSATTPTGSGSATVRAGIGRPWDDRPGARTPPPHARGSSIMRRPVRPFPLATAILMPSRRRRSKECDIGSGDDDRHHVAPAGARCDPPPLRILR